MNQSNLRFDKKYLIYIIYLLTLFLHQSKLELRFRELLDDAEIDLIEDQEKIETLCKEVGLSTEQMQDILLELIHERKKEQLEQEKNKYFFCPHCGHKLPD